MFGPDFYPTPKEVIEMMLSCTSVMGKVVLEPSAGKGSIVEHLKNSGAKDVIACEIEPNLCAILEKKCRLIASDFLTLKKEQISHVNLIVMNPPFSEQEKHILHAIDIAPGGCEIISLCNETLITNQYIKSRAKVMEYVKNNGTFEHFGSCFSNSERTTDVRVSCLRIYVPKEDESEFEDYFDMSDDEHVQRDVPGIVTYDYVFDVVSRYVGAVKMFDEVIDAGDRMRKLIDPIDAYLNVLFGCHEIDGHRTRAIDRDTFKKRLQISAWKTLFSKFRLEKYVTSGVMSDINKAVEQQVHIPFTMKNVYRMVEMVVGTAGDRMNKVLVEAFEKICSYSHENSTAGEGWKTNSDYKINRKFIKPYVTEYDNRWPSENVKISYRGTDSLDDIVKALCYLTGKNFDEVMKLEVVDRYGRKDVVTNTVSNFCSYNKIPWGCWAEWTFFRIKGFKKGTMHFEFLDPEVHELFNRKVAEIKGWRLPRSTKNAYRAKSEEVTLFN